VVRNCLTEGGKTSGKEARGICRGKGRGRTVLKDGLEECRGLLKETAWESAWRDGISKGGGFGAGPRNFANVEKSEGGRERKPGCMLRDFGERDDGELQVPG